MRCFEDFFKKKCTIFILEWGYCLENWLWKTKTKKKNQKTGDFLFSTVRKSFDKDLSALTEKIIWKEVKAKKRSVSHKWENIRKDEEQKAKERERERENHETSKESSFQAPRSQVRTFEAIPLRGRWPSEDNQGNPTFKELTRTKD